MTPTRWYGRTSPPLCQAAGLVREGATASFRLGTSSTCTVVGKVEAVVTYRRCMVMHTGGIIQLTFAGKNLKSRADPGQIFFFE
jgi:hypothetical protein